MTQWHLYLLFIAAGLVLAKFIQAVQHKYRYSRVLPFQVRASLDEQNYRLTDNITFDMRRSEMYVRHASLITCMVLQKNRAGKWQPYAEHPQGNLYLVSHIGLFELEEQQRERSFKIMETKHQAATAA